MVSNLIQSSGKTNLEQEIRESFINGADFLTIDVEPDGSLLFLEEIIKMAKQNGKKLESLTLHLANE